ncbi:MAG: hypothetical protein UT30_C0001G0017 [Candidatus Uhrbacteria bacterium GW2011_GWF2_39_13]|uniref:Uncharacterized protein n=1 Tax=Candidatus Uhrbacteria bacterium GW2011_GWF2_39_13 TaxID=1618995 RepID=A0A0G0MPJ8_9BACT|nr:MAG: hypothetical protein UT30_C0001G0017 [Candidatus Uhrbacteria bacterium GW2011_GWF2_39_13]
MKKFFLVFSLILVFSGGGCVSTPVSQTEITNQEAAVSDKVLQEPVGELQTEDEFTGPTETMDPITEDELGFSVEAPEGWGEFSAILYRRWWPQEPGLGEDKEYRGIFSEQSAVIYRTTLSAVAREGYIGDAQGYLKKEDGYYLLSPLSKEPQMRVPDELIVGEVPLANATALLLKGSSQDEEGPSFFPNDPDEFAAVINTPDGAVTGGVFIGNMDGQPVISMEAFKAMLLGVTLE